MTQNTIGILQRAADLGLKLAFEPPNTLTYEPIENCPAEFADALKDHKWLLLDLLRLPFVLVEAGADSWSIYTKDELRVLVAQNRIAPLCPAELRKVHEIKRTFSGRISS